MTGCTGSDAAGARGGPTSAAVACWHGSELLASGQGIMDAASGTSAAAACRTSMLLCCRLRAQSDEHNSLHLRHGCNSDFEMRVKASNSVTSIIKLA